MTTTISPDLLAHVAAVRDGACDDHDLLVLADRVQEAGDDDRAELIRLCVRSEGAPTRPGTHDVSFRQWKYDTDRIAELLGRNPSWLSVPCPECGGRGWIYSGHNTCQTCDGTGDLLRRNNGSVRDEGLAVEPRASITRGFLDVTLPAALCWADVGCRNGRQEYRPHPALRAILASPVGPWVRRVRVEGREPRRVSLGDDGDYYLWHSGTVMSSPYVLPPAVWKLMGDVWFDTAEAAADALSLAVARWARGEG